MRRSVTRLLDSYRGRIIFAAIILLIGVGLSWAVAPTNIPLSSGNPNENTSSAVRVKVERINTDGTWFVEIQDGKYAGSKTAVERQRYMNDVSAGDVVVLTMSGSGEVISSDYWRVPGMIILLAALIIIVALISGKQGLFSLAGLGFGIAVIGAYTIPAILDGQNAFLVCVFSAFVIGTIAVYVSHGMNHRAAASIISIAIILCITMLLSVAAGALTGLTGVTDEITGHLYAHFGRIDLRGVLTGGIILATLGMIDDVVATQAASADELLKANPRLSPLQLFHRTMSIGNEHIAALINTLALAYVGVALPMILLVAATSTTQGSILSLLNQEFLAQEIVRTLVSSIALVLAVPVSTAVAVIWLRVVAIRRAKRTKALS